MNNCSQCGSSIPNGQSICSMCMGDINYGDDGHYEQWAADQEAIANQAQYEAEQNAQGEAESQQY